MSAERLLSNDLIKSCMFTEWGPGSITWIVPPILQPKVASSRRAEAPPNIRFVPDVQSSGVHGMHGLPVALHTPNGKMFVPRTWSAITATGRKSASTWLNPEQISGAGADPESQLSVAVVTTMCSIRWHGH